MSTPKAKAQSRSLRDLAGDERIQRILIIKWSAMGDVALASAGFEDIARAFPGREIDLSTLPPWDQLYRHDPRFRQIIATDLRAGRGQLRASVEWLREVGKRRYDLVIDLQTTDRSRLLLGALWLTGGWIPHRAGNKAAQPYNRAPPGTPGARHAMDIIERTLDSIGVQASTPRPVLHCPPERRDQVRKLLRDEGLKPNEYGVFLPGSQAAGYLKRWGAARYATLGRALREAGVRRMVILGGPDEREESREIADASGAWMVDLCGRTELLDIVPICEDARFVVGNDTGTAHVAAAAARPMVVICGPTDPARVLPAGDNVVAMQAPLPCINCYRKHCAHHSCMAWITPQMVVHRLRELEAL